MDIDFSDFQQESVESSETIIIYSAPGMGKTTFLSQFPNAVLFDLEDGTKGLKFNHFPIGKLMNEQPLPNGKHRHVFKDYNELLWGISELSKGKLPFKWLLIDSISVIHKMIERQAAVNHSVASYDKIGYGKGPEATITVWNEFLSRLSFLKTHLNINIIMTGHAEITKFKDPQGEDYNYYQIDANQQAHNLLYRWANIVLFINEKARVQGKDSGFGKKSYKATGTEPRVLCTTKTAFWDAKNRNGLPYYIPFGPTNGYEKLMSAMSEHSTTERSTTLEEVNQSEAPPLAQPVAPPEPVAPQSV